MKCTTAEKIAKIEWIEDFRVILTDSAGFESDYADHLARVILAGLQERRGAGEHYLPAADKAERNARIREEFNGRNRDEICAKYGIGKSQLYEIMGSR